MATEKADPNIKLDQEASSGDHERRIRKSDRAGDFFCSLPKWIAYAVIAWQASLSIVALAGQNSLASFLVRFSRQTSWWELICWGAALLGIFYGLYAGHLLHKQMANDLARLTAIERRLFELQSATPQNVDASSKIGDLL